MPKAVVCILVATALVLFLIISHNSNPNYYELPKTRRFGTKTTFPTFDPLVVKMQRKQQQKKSKSKRSLADREREMNYYNNDGSLNVRLRLMVLFPFLDIAPRDGMVDSKELDAWLMQQTIDRLHDMTQRELESRDKDGDGAVSFFEYLPQFTAEDIERNETRHGEAGWWMEQFKNADLDRNGALNLYEFRDFMHPEDSRNEQIHRWLLREKISLMDKDKDRKLNLPEFESGAYNSYKAYVEYESGADQVLPSEVIFSKLDLDKDRLLRIEELKPLIQYLCPGELTYSKYYTIHLIKQADDNGDGKLTLEEMLNHEYIFYNSVHESSKSGSYHDEL